ncbi:acylphosphatase [Alkalicoccobacillus murimartini]|uniref:Acylphosphatase n=1 Tax=Alkalicoccobacillus murimartini TaxID=171685 RepID=A0ABT9YEB0_9BACI|nr:acylphosphatase [Alkalicoccobacillus murimartini]MDQ0206196.1 acylphosphatase [Alkalicoccobacillus murimartini]
MKNRYHLIIEGKVQGVGFRYFTQEQATRFGLVGWVRNLDNGTVEVEVEGDEDKMEPFFDALKTKNRFARVDQVHLQLVENLRFEAEFVFTQ